MCNIIVINRGEKEIGTPKQFLDHFGFMPEKEKVWSYDQLEMCLCQYDIEKTLSDNNIEFKKDCGDIYVGMLDQVIES